MARPRIEFAAPAKRAPIDYASDYTRLHPRAKAADFYPNGKLLPDDQIKTLKFGLMRYDEDARYSKSFLENHSIHINRGGVVRVYNQTTCKYELYAVYKTLPEPNPEEEAVFDPEKPKAIILGKGAYGKVQIIQNLETGEFKAIKVLLNPNYQEEFKYEAKGLQKLNRGYGCVIKKKLAAGEVDKGRLYIIQDLAPGKDLYETLKASKLSVAERFDIMLKMLKCIQELHDTDMLHRDIKLENFMYDPVTKTVSIIDFGLWQQKGALYDKFCGTPGYIAPEIYREEKYSPASDTFALGKIAQELFGIQTKTEDGKIIEPLDNNARNHFTATELEESKKIIDKMLYYSPSRRLSIPEANQLFQVMYFRKFPAAQVDTPQQKLDAQLAAVEKQSEIISKKIDKNIRIPAENIATIMAYAADPNSKLASSEAQTTAIKNKCLVYAKQVFDMFKQKQLNYFYLCLAMEKLTAKLETLPHFGFLSKRKNKPSPSVSAGILQTAIMELKALLELPRAALVDNPSDENNSDEIPYEYMIAMETNLLLKQKINQKIDVSATTINEIDAYANDHSCRFAKSKEETDTVKNTCLAHAYRLLEQYQAQTISLENLHPILNNLTRKVEALPHLGFLSRHTQKTSPTAIFMRQCSDLFRALSLPPLASIADVINQLKPALNDKAAGYYNNIIRALEEFESTRNRLYLTQAINTIEELKILPKDRSTNNKLRMPSEIMIDKIDKYLRGIEKAPIQEEQQVPQQRLH